MVALAPVPCNPVREKIEAAMDAPAAGLPAVSPAEEAVGVVTLLRHVQVEAVRMEATEALELYLAELERRNRTALHIHEVRRTCEHLIEHGRIVGSCIDIAPQGSRVYTAARRDVA